jgi:hypothetical protein
MHEYENRPRKDHRDVDLISDVLPFGRLWYERGKCGRECSWLRDAIGMSYGGLLRKQNSG